MREANNSKTQVRSVDQPKSIRTNLNKLKINTQVDKIVTSKKYFNSIKLCCCTRLREKVESQELKLRKLRTMRGQTDLISKTNNHSLTNDLESSRRVFNEKEKELAMAVTKVH